ncbi:type IX secretion system protein PorD [Pedobacter psychrophilus]
MKKLLLLICICLTINAEAQDLNARVQILSPQIQNTNNKPIEALQQAMSEFLNNRKWSVNELKSQERIDCNIVFNLKEWDGSSNYKGEAQIISSRPVYGTSYNTTLLSVTDKNFEFTYTEGQPLDFSDQNFQNNLSSILAFYAYIIVGLDADSFSKLGGTDYFTKAQTVLNNAQNAPFGGWKAFENLRNRYWIAENLQNKTFIPLREVLYTYHRQGLDLMSDDINKGKKNIATSIEKLTELDKQKQGSILNNIFFSAKADEIIDIFKKSDPLERTKVYNTMVEVDPANSSKYEELKTAK